MDLSSSETLPRSLIQAFAVSQPDCHNVVQPAATSSGPGPRPHSSGPCVKRAGCSSESRSERDQIPMTRGTALCALALVTACSTNPTAPTEPGPPEPSGPGIPQETWRGVTIANEDGCSPYDSEDYSYPAAVKNGIVNQLGGGHLQPVHLRALRIDPGERHRTHHRALGGPRQRTLQRKFSQEKRLRNRRPQPDVGRTGT